MPVQPISILIDINGDPIAVNNNLLGVDGSAVVQPTSGTGSVSVGNSSTTLLGISEVFTGTFEDVKDYAMLSVSVFSDVASASNGLNFEWSHDGINVDVSEPCSILAGSGRGFSLDVVARYFRVRYVNDVIAQTVFRLGTVYHSSGGPIHADTVDDTGVSRVAVDAKVTNTTAIPVTVSGGGGGANQADKSAFTEGTSFFNPIGGVRNDAPGVDPAEDTAACARITPKRAIHVNFRDNNGTEFGTPTNPIIIAPQSAGASTAGFNFGDITTAVIAVFAVRRTTYTEQTSDAQRSIISSSASDTAAGTGARTVKITYYTSTGTGPFTETITLNGTSGVATVNTNICFIEKMEVVTVGTGFVNAGTITLRVNAMGGATIGTIATGDNQTFWCHHYVPTGVSANITAQWAGHNGTTVGSGGTFIIKQKPIGVANAVEVQVSDSFRLYGQSSSVQRNYGTPIKVVGPARITTYITPETSTTINYRASFDFFEQ